MSNDALSKFDLWYFTQFGNLLEFGIEQHRAGALAAWSYFHEQLTEIALECNPEQHSNEDYSVTEAKLNVAAKIVSLVGAE